MKKIVFVGQLAGADPAKIEKEYGTINDPEAAQRFGVRLLKEFSFWSWRSCAIANVAMILETEGLFEGTLYDLVCEALWMNGYAYRNRRGAKDIGWEHTALCQLLRRRGLRAQARKHLTLNAIKKILAKGRYVILSVRSKSGGHMVLVKALTDQDITYNDPYLFKGHGGENVKEALASFEKKSLRRGVVAW